MRNIRPPDIIACSRSQWQNCVHRDHTYSNDMTELMRSDGKEFEGIDNVANAGYVPEPKDDNCHCDYLHINRFMLAEPSG